MNAGRAVLEGAPEYTWDSAMTDAPATTTEAAPADTTTTTEAAPAMTPDATTPDATTPEAAAPMREPLQRDGFAALDTATLTSEDLTGASVYDSSDARIGEIHVYERASGHVHVEALAQGLSDEIHADQAAFAAAYGL